MAALINKKCFGAKPIKAAPWPQHATGMTERPWPQHCTGMTVQPWPQHRTGMTMLPWPQHGTGMTEQSCHSMALI